MLTFLLLLMTALAWRLGAFEEWQRHRQLAAFDRDLWLEIDEASWEDRQEAFRRKQGPIGHRRAHLRLGRRR
ncbi:MAG: hypothetical protein O3C45_00875 [Bacteroidetes bacterium]|nr:hypothetical protein [Bacteroidota bacterium]MDA0873592.1 hypothetical protein [Bacteroidota bacterium]